METLPQAMERLRREMVRFPTPKTFLARLEKAIDFDIISNNVDEVARDLNMYIGEKRWFRRPDNFFELRVGYASTAKEWYAKYGIK